MFYYRGCQVTALFARCSLFVLSCSPTFPMAALLCHASGSADNSDFLGHSELRNKSRIHTTLNATVGTFRSLKQFAVLNGFTDFSASVARRSGRRPGVNMRIFGTNCTASLPVQKLQKGVEIVNNPPGSTSLQPGFCPVWQAVN